MNEVEVEDGGTSIDTYGGAVCENYMLKLSKLHKENRIPRYFVEVSLYGERLIRKMARVETMDGWRYADIVTGSLYDPNTGKCNSADIKIVKVRKDIPEVKKKVVKKAVKKAVKKVAKKAVKKKVKK
jgi:hypothetical protein